MKKLKFPDKEVDYAMRRGVIDLLTVIPIKHLKMRLSLWQEWLRLILLNSMVMILLSTLMLRSGGMISGTHTSGKLCQFNHIA